MENMSIGRRLNGRVTHNLSVRLTAEQRNVIALALLQLRLDLIEAVHGERYEPHAECPKCHRQMNPLEIIRGFSADPNDFTTACTGCYHRFEAKLVCKQYQGAATVEIPFYCSVQTLAQLSGKEMITVEVFKETYPALYHSAVFHHGGLRQAVEKIGVQYPYEELCDWKDKVKQFLGELPDTIIASCLGKPVRAIRTLRKQFRIPPCRVRKYAFEG